MAENSDKTAKKKRRGPGKPFAAGQSGNPGGRPKTIAEVRELARSYTVEAIEAMAQIMLAGESEAARVAAAEKVLDRGWGKAPVTASGEGGEGDARQHHAIELVIVDPAKTSG